MTTDTNGVGFGSVASRIRTASGATLAVLLIAYLYTVVTAPIDATQGVIQKILYVHVPLAYGAYLGFVVTAVSGALYLWKADEKWDRLAVAGAEVGVIFCTLMLVTGPIWARGTWGKWWSWDPRLTVTLLLWFVYLAYLLLRKYGGPGSEKLSAGLAIFGMMNVPFVYVSVNVWRTLHPQTTVVPTLPTSMAGPFWWCVLAYFAMFWVMLDGRRRLEYQRAVVDRLRLSMDEE